MSVEHVQFRATGPAKAPAVARSRSRPRARPTRAPNLDVIQAKVRPPTLRPGIVARGSLVSRLRRDGAAVATVVAPAGYGKTTLLTQWAAAEARPAAWLSVDARDNDPFVLLQHLVAAVDRAQPLDRRLLAALGSRRRAAPALLLKRAADAFASCEGPFLLVLDNADLLHSPEARHVASILTARLPRGSTLALAGRTPPRVPIGALRSRGGLRHVAVDELALTRREAQLLLQGTNAQLSAEQTATLIELCEGWPAALYLAALAAAQATTESPSGFGGTDRYLAEYLRSEYLAQVRPRDLRFLRRASILAELTGSLCDAVLQVDDSESRLERLAGANLGVVPIGGRHRGYRFHHLFGEFLLRELADEEPQVIPGLHRRAADWYELRGDPYVALEHAESAGDADRVAALTTAIALPASSQRRAQEVERRLARFDAVWHLERYPTVALHGSWIHAFRGRAAEAERWLDIAGHGARRHTREAAARRAVLPVVRAALCRDGVRGMIEDADAALARLPRASQWYPEALLVRGSAAMLVSDNDAADALLADAARTAALHGCVETEMIAVGQRSVLARSRDELDRADTLAAEASTIVSRAELADFPTAAIAFAASAHAALRHGRWAEARELVDAAEPLRASVTEALPWLAVGIRLELARCYLTLRDLDAARALVAEIDAVLELRPRLGMLVERARVLRADVAAFADPQGGSPVGLTPAELRLLPLLATHLSFREIAEQLHVSRNTVKTQAISIYRKLGASGRSDAIRITASRRGRAA